MGNGVAQLLRLGPGVQRIDPDGLEPLVLAILAGVACIAKRFAQATSIGCAVTGAGKAGRIDRGLGEQQRVTMHELPVPAQAPQIQAQHARGQVRMARFGQDQKPGVVGNQMQVLELNRPSPANPAIARTAHQRASLPLQQRQPLTAPVRHLSERPTGGAVEARIMVAAQQRVPARAFIRPDRADDDLGKNDVAVAVQALN